MVLAGYDQGTIDTAWPICYTGSVLAKKKLGQWYNKPDIQIATIVPFTLTLF